MSGVHGERQELRPATGSGKQAGHTRICCKNGFSNTSIYAHQDETLYHLFLRREIVAASTHQNTPHRLIPPATASKQEGERKRDDKEA